MSTINSTGPDTQNMVVVHRVFRREFRLLPGLVEKVAEADTARAAELAEHCSDLVTALHHHHAGEDDLLWPPLLEQATLHSDLVHRMEEQHASMSEGLEKIEALLPVWAEHARTAERDQLAVAVREVFVILAEHLAEEEREILPLVEEHLSVQQWEALGKRGSESIADKAKLLIFLGMILEDATPQERTEFLRHLPLPARIMWRLMGGRQYGRYIARIRAA